MCLLILIISSFVGDMIVLVVYSSIVVLSCKSSALYCTVITTVLLGKLIA